MADITLDGDKTQTSGTLPQIGSTAPSFTLTETTLSSKSLADFDGFKKIINIFPSVETGVCAKSVREFNEKASAIPNTKVLCISRDLPFAQSRFCAAEGLDNVIMLSDFKNEKFGKQYGTTILDGSFQGLHSRAIVVLDENNQVLHVEQVPEIGQEPDYDSAIKAVK